MKKVHWIRLDIPYQPDSNQLRAVAGFINEAGNEEEFVSGYFGSIEAALEAIEDEGLSTTQETVLVFPLDGRDDLAWEVKEAADEHAWKYARFIPQEHSPGPQVPLSFELDETGSREDELRKDDAQRTVFELNNAALDDCDDHKYSESLSKIRHALQLAYRYFGWTSPGIVFCLTTFADTMRATGSKVNVREAVATIDRMIWQWEQELPTAATWRGADKIMEHLIEACEDLGAKAQVEDPQRWAKKIGELRKGFK